ncbi:MAG: twin-arginine translocase TatA/TatE family subunit [Methylocella sp.]
MALIVIGPKDLPRVLRELGRAVAKMRRMATEFQGQFMEAVREADMADIRDDVAKLAESARVDVPFNPVADIKNELKGAVEKASPSASASAPVSDLAAAEAEISSSLLAFPHLSDPPPETAGLLKAPSRKPGAGEGGAGAPADEKLDPSAETGIDAEMQALADALKAEIGAAPQVGAAPAPGRVSTLRDNV